MSCTLRNRRQGVANRRQGLAGSALALLLAATGLAIAAPSRAGAQVFGFNVQAAQEHLPGSPTSADVAMLGAQAGAQAERMTISWKEVQPVVGLRGRPASHWGPFDHEVAAMQARGIRPLIMIANAPKWADGLGACTGDHCPPDNAHLDDWRRFAGAVAARYPTAVGIEIWNAPNTKAWWHTRHGPSARQYAHVFGAAARGIHYWNPSMRILFGSVGYSYRGDIKGGILSIPTFLKYFYLNVDYTQFRAQDGLSVRAYPMPPEVDTLDGQFARTMAQVRKARDTYDPSRQIWVTETGVTTTGPNAATEDQQARGDVNALRNLQASSDVGGVFIHTLVEPLWNPGSPSESGFGVVTRGSLQPRPAYCAIAQLITGGSPAGCP
jgi:hypothetical protein